MSGDLKMNLWYLSKYSWYLWTDRKRLTERKLQGAFFKRMLSFWWALNCQQRYLSQFAYPSKLYPGRRSSSTPCSPTCQRRRHLCIVYSVSHPRGSARLVLTALSLWLLYPCGIKMLLSVRRIIEHSTSSSNIFRIFKKLILTNHYLTLFR